MKARAYYNEIEPFAAQWLRNLIDAGHIAEGDVDERSIVEVEASDLRKYDQCHFFAGIGVWSYALRSAGWTDDRNVWTGSCPCQPFSVAGLGQGFADERHLWPTWFQLIEKCRPPVVFGKQVASPDGLGWLDTVSADMEGAGYAFGAADLCAAGVGAPHVRQRLFFVADASSVMGNPDGAGPQVGPGRPDGRRAIRIEGSAVAETGAVSGYWGAADLIYCRDGKYRPVEPGTFPLAHGVTNRVGRLRATGNALVAPVAEAFVRAYITLNSD